MPAPSELTPEHQAQLVAYLDGELDEQEALQVEQWLAQSPSARRELERLQRTWDLLNLLPENKASQEFTRQTVSQMRKLALAGEKHRSSATRSIAPAADSPQNTGADADPEGDADPDFLTDDASAETEIATAAIDAPDTEVDWWRQVRVLTVWSVLLGTSMACGYLSTHRWWRDPLRPLIDELPLLENVDRYQEAGDLQFLQELRRRGTLAERPPEPSP